MALLQENQRSNPRPELLPSVTRSLQCAFKHSYELSHHASSALRTFLFSCSKQVICDWILRLLDILILFMSSKDWTAILRLWDLGIMNAFSVQSQVSEGKVSTGDELRNWSSTSIQTQRESVLLFIKENWPNFDPLYTSSVSLVTIMF